MRGEPFDLQKERARQRQFFEETGMSAILRWWEYRQWIDAKEGKGNG